MDKPLSCNRWSQTHLYMAYYRSRINAERPASIGVERPAFIGEKPMQVKTLEVNENDYRSDEVATYQAVCERNVFMASASSFGLW